MPLGSGYGVLVGTLHRYYRDPVEGYGDYYHANIDVLTPGGVYHCKLDVDEKSPGGVMWRVVEVSVPGLKEVASLPDGWHTLAPDPRSGALDYLRSPELDSEALPGQGLADSAPEAAGRGLGGRGHPRWSRGTTEDALADLERLLDDARRLFVFGEPFSHGRGVHNIHQNQGDPAGSIWWAENSVWQDGGLVVEREAGSFVAFLSRYAT